MTSKTSMVSEVAVRKFIAIVRRFDLIEEPTQADVEERDAALEEILSTVESLIAERDHYRQRALLGEQTDAEERGLVMR